MAEITEKESELYDRYKNGEDLQLEDFQTIMDILSTRAESEKNVDETSDKNFDEAVDAIIEKNDGKTEKTYMDREIKNESIPTVKKKKTSPTLPVLKPGNSQPKTYAILHGEAPANSYGTPWPRT